MPVCMKYFKHVKRHFSDRDFLHSIVVALCLFSVGLLMNFYAGTYATEEASGSVTDIILSNTRAYDVDGIFIYGSYAMTVLIIFLMFRKLNTLPFIMETIALFVMIRSLFVSLTHIGPFPTQITIHSDLLSRISFGGDLFFSGHTGLPFLMALIFWNVRPLRYIFIVISLSFGVVVLLGHLHYTIDVLSAFFITYGIFDIAKILFKKDYELFRDGISENL